MRMPSSIPRPLILMGVFLIAMLGAPAGWADGGGPGTGPGGGCRVQLGSHLVTFIAYQPQLAGNTPYCSEIPALGNVAVVFDYEGKETRSLPVEFEITKVSGGTRVLYQPPELHPTGTFTRNVNFTEPGDYEARVSLVQDGKQYEAHVPFSVAEEGGLSLNTLLIIAVILITAGYFLYQSNQAFQDAIKRLLAKLG